ncbi:MAG: hypothetical protein JXA30_04485 [Deltaproteobacteria bacterium]|nr:hypothetical protein [Deltaproteobacteria bacterium]
MIQKQRRGLVPIWILLSVGVWLLAATAPSIGAAQSVENSAHPSDSEYRFWKEVGAHTAIKALWMMRAQGIHVRSSGDFVVLTNAGYAKVDERDTMGALDGLTKVLKVGRGNHSLVEVHSAPNASLWFAVYHQSSGACAYLQIDPESLAGVDNVRDVVGNQLYSIKALEFINAQRLYANAAEYGEKFNNLVFGGNEFRIVTIANGIANGASTDLVRAFELHDHYCPGVTSGGEGTEAKNARKPNLFLRFLPPSPLVWRMKTAHSQTSLKSTSLKECCL